MFRFFKPIDVLETYGKFGNHGGFGNLWGFWKPVGVLETRGGFGNRL
jgi:hypothetical protein